MPPMFACPNCGCTLARMPSTAGVYWACSSCGGRTVAMPILRKVVGEAPVTRLWADARAAQIGRKRCPTCRQPMHATRAGGLHLDVCKLCQFVWFDIHEFEQMPVASPMRPQRVELPQAAKEALAIHQVQLMGEQLREEMLASGPPEAWQNVPAFFGLPVECDTPNMTGYPAVTWTTALAVLIASIAAFIIGHSVIQNFALVPAEVGRYGGLTFISSFFLHGGVLHLVSNLYFLLIFGDNVEEYLGRWRFGALLLGATLAGGVAHVVGDPRTEIPCIGASGGISGLITFYALQFPHARLGLFVRYHWVNFPAWAALILWVILQAVGVAQQISGFSNVSALAHLGGATVGLLAWAVWRSKRVS